MGILKIRTSGTWRRVIWYIITRMLSAISGKWVIVIVISLRKLNRMLVKFLERRPTQSMHHSVPDTQTLFKCCNYALQQKFRVLLSDGLYRKYNVDCSDSALMVSTIPSPNKRLAPSASHSIKHHRMLVRQELRGQFEWGGKGTFGRHSFRMRTFSQDNSTAKQWREFSF
jgi:DNA-binding HxlR family transcriptional regulator